MREKIYLKFTILFIIAVLACVSFVSLSFAEDHSNLVAKLPNGGTWSKGDWWLVELWQKADHWAVPNPPWIKAQVLKFEISEVKGIGKKKIYTVHLSCPDGEPISGKIKTIDIYYDQNLKLLPTGLSPKDSKSSLGYAAYFMLLKLPAFEIPEKLSENPEKLIDPSSEKGVAGYRVNVSKSSYQVWNRNKEPWWSFYQDSDTLIVAKLIDHGRRQN